MQSGVKPVILAIDDDVVILNTVVSTLRSEYSVRPFTSGDTALRFLSSQSADLILLDCQMPGKSGFDVLQFLVHSPMHSHIPVIFITGSTDGESEAKALEMGAMDYLHKPVRPRALITRVKLQLELQSHRRHLEALVEEKTRSLNDAYNKLKLREDITLGLLARATDLRDGDTGQHIARTTEIVRIIALDLVVHPRPGYTLTKQGAEEIIKSAKLHDLGKIASPDHILLTPDKLPEEEYRLIKEHTVRGEQLLTDFISETDDSFLKTARDIAHSHHERWDGRGYPLHLAGEEIPLSARIVAIADVYDALSSVRPYKEAYSHEDSARMILEERGRHFDPYLVSVFERHLDEIAAMSGRSAHPVGEPG
ncbi:MAG: response regulator [Planctomycetaceae bacterium]|nr:response regulator [Planctomycetaceae bacterium]